MSYIKEKIIGYKGLLELTTSSKTGTVFFAAHLVLIVCAGLALCLHRFLGYSVWFCYVTAVMMVVEVVVMTVVIWNRLAVLSLLPMTGIMAFAASLQLYECLTCFPSSGERIISISLKIATFIILAFYFGAYSCRRSAIDYVVVVFSVVAAANFIMLLVTYVVGNFILPESFLNLDEIRLLAIWLLPAIIVVSCFCDIEFGKKYEIDKGMLRDKSWEIINCISTVLLSYAGLDLLIRNYYEIWSVFNNSVNEAYWIASMASLIVVYTLNSISGKNRGIR